MSDETFEEDITLPMRTRYFSYYKSVKYTQCSAILFNLLVYTWGCFSAKRKLQKRKKFLP